MTVVIPNNRNAVVISGELGYRPGPGVEPGPPQEAPPISCLWGEPYKNTEGEWMCPSPPNQQTGPLGNGNPRAPGSGTTVIYVPTPTSGNDTATKPTAAVDDGFTIFGFSGWLVLAAAGAGLYFFSQMGGDEKSTASPKKRTQLIF